MRKIELYLYWMFPVVSLIAFLAGGDAIAIGTSETVDIILQKEIRTLAERDGRNVAPESKNPAKAASNSLPTSEVKEMGVELVSIYGVGADLRVTLKYRDTLYSRIRIGQDVGAFVLMSVEGTCASLAFQASKNGKPVHVCWSKSPSEIKPSLAGASSVPNPNEMSKLPPVTGVARPVASLLKSN